MSSFSNSRGGGECPLCPLWAPMYMCVCVCFCFYFMCTSTFVSWKNSSPSTQNCTWTFISHFRWTASNDVKCSADDDDFVNRPVAGRQAVGAPDGSHRRHHHQRRIAHYRHHHHVMTSSQTDHPSNFLKQISPSPKFSSTPVLKNCVSSTRTCFTVRHWSAQCPL